MPDQTTDTSTWPPVRSATPSEVARAHERGAPRPWSPPDGAMRRRGAASAELLRAAREPLRLAARARRLATAPRGDGRPVLALPGFQAPEASMRPIAAYLRHLGHDARTWGLGRNEGRPERDRDRVLAVVRPLAAAEGPVALVGWSLGGVIAREVARDAPDLVRTVVTYGTPVVGGPTYSVAAAAWPLARQQEVYDTIDREDRERPIRVPVRAVVSRRDRVVDWRAQVDVRSTDVRHTEVASSHLGLGLDPEVWLAVATALADDDA